MDLGYLGDLWAIPGGWAERYNGERFNVGRSDVDRWHPGALLWFNRLPKCAGFTKEGAGRFDNIGR
jgi:hypothetical protein